MRPSILRNAFGQIMFFHRKGGAYNLRQYQMSICPRKAIGRDSTVMLLDKNTTCVVCLSVLVSTLTRI